MRLPSAILLGSALLSLFACGSPSEVPEGVHARDSTTPQENAGMHARNVELAERARAHPDAKLVFLGDSITQGWDSAGRATWDLDFAAYAPLNLGVSGDRTEHVLWRLARGDYDHLRPELIVTMIGTNNTGHRMDAPEDISAGVAAILADLKRRFPSSKLAVLAIFPRGEAPDDPMRRNNDAANLLLAKVAKAAGAHWLDLTRAFVDARGVLAKDLMPDLLHPSERGYEVWSNAIGESLKRWMGKAPARD